MLSMIYANSAAACLARQFVYTPIAYRVMSAPNLMKALYTLVSGIVTES